MVLLQPRCTSRAVGDPLKDSFCNFKVLDYCAFFCLFLKCAFDFQIPETLRAHAENCSTFILKNYIQREIFDIFRELLISKQFVFASCIWRCGSRASFNSSRNNQHEIEKKREEVTNKLKDREGKTENYMKIQCGTFFWRRRRYPNVCTKMRCTTYEHVAEQCRISERSLRK